MSGKEKIGSDEPKITEGIGNRIKEYEDHFLNYCKISIETPETCLNQLNK